MEERLGELMVGAVERMLPLLDFQGIEEELRREPENSGSESWRRWEQRLLTRLLLRVTEVVALQQEGPGSREEIGEKHNLCERKDSLVEGRAVKRVYEYGGKDQNKGTVSIASSLWPQTQEKMWVLQVQKFFTPCSAHI